MLNPRGLLGDVLGHALPSHPVPFFMFGKLKKSYTYKTYRSLTDGSGTYLSSFVQFSRLVTELFWSFSDLMHISLCFLSRKQGSVKCLTNKKLMATVKTVLVKGRSNRSGKFPLVVQVLHKRRKKVVYTGFSIPDTLFDPVKGRVIDGGENTPESIRRINHRCESISRVLLKCISMIEKKSREYEIEDVFRTYGVLTHEAGFYFYFSRKIRELRESGHEGTARAYASSLRSMQRYLGKKNFPFIKLSSRIISDYQGKLLASIEAYEEIVAYARKKQAETGSKLLWGTANVFGHARYMNGAATNPDFDVVARAAVQIKNALDATIALGGENYVFWGGREGYMSLLNTDQKREKNHLALLLAKARDYARSQGFKGTFLIEPKPMEPMKHQYDADTETVIGFLKAHGLDKDFKVNIEVNHATLAGHSKKVNFRWKICGNMRSLTENPNKPAVNKNYTKQ